MTTVEENQKVNSFIEFIIKYSLIIGPIVCFLVSFALAFTPVWQLVFLAGIISGLFYTEMKKGAIVGLVGVGLGWTLYIIIEIASSKVNTIINQILDIIAGASNANWLVYLILIILGCLFGVLGGSLGSGIRRLIVQFKKNETQNTTQVE